MSKKYIGVDIGKSGAIVVIDGSVITSFPMPMIGTEVDYAFLKDIIENASQHKNAHLVFEKLGVIFGTSKATAFSMGHQSGALEMLAISLGLPYTKVPAKQWQKEMFQGVEEITKVGKSARDTKAMALIAAKRIFPDVKYTFGKGTKPNDGLVDALLMAEYARRKNL
jgi:hypothetical protein